MLCYEHGSKHCIWRFFTFVYYVHGFPLLVIQRNPADACQESSSFWNDYDFTRLACPHL